MATTEQGVKLTVTGEQALSKALKSVDAALKNLDQATKKAASAFDTFEAASKRAQKASVLTDKLEIQGKTLEMLQAKLTATSAKYGDSSEQSQRVQLAIDKLTLSMKQNQNALDALTKEQIAEKKAQEEALAAKARAADAAGKAANATADLRAKLEAEAKAQADATRSTLAGVNATDQVDDAAKRASAGIDKLGTSLNDTGKHFNAFGEIAVGALRRVGELMVNAALEIGRRIASALGSAITTSGDYEAALNRFSAVAGDAIAEAGMSLETFDKLALKMGAETQFSALQAADAMVNLAKGGIDPATIAAGGLEAVLSLAAAGELDLANAAEITAKQLGVWKVTGLQAAEVADLLAQAANASTVDVDELALGMANAGGVAKAVGASFADTVQVMALLAPGFSSASDAGTSLKVMLTRLQPKTGPTVKAFQELNLLAEDGSSLFYDLNGTFIGFEGAAELLQNRLGGLTKAQQEMYLTQLFGQDAVRAGLALVEAGAEGFNAMGASMVKAGSAMEQAAKRNQGFNFAVESLKGSLETLAIVIGKIINPAITSFINSALIPATNAVTGFFQEIIGAKNVSQTFDNVAQGVKMIDKFGVNLKGTIPGAFSLMVLRAQEVNKSISRMAESFRGVIPDVALDNFERLLRAAYDLGVTIFPDLAKGADDVGDAMSSFAGSALSSMFDSLTSAIQTVTKNWSGILKAVETTKSVISGAISTIMQFKDAIIGAFAGVAVVSGIAIIATALSAIGAALAAVLSPIGLVVAAVAALSAAWYTNFGGIQEVVASVVPYVMSAFDMLSSAVFTALNFVIETFTPVYQAIQLFGAGAVQEIYNFVTGAETSFSNLKVILAQALISVNTFAFSIAATLLGALPTFYAAVAKYAFAAVSWIAQALPTALSALGSFVASMATYVVGRLPDWIAAFLVWATEAVAWIGRAIPNLLTQLANFLTNITMWSDNSAMPEFVAIGAKFGAALADWVYNDLIPKVAPAFEAFKIAMKEALKKIIEAARTEGGRIAKALIDGVISSLRDGVAKVKEAVASLFNSATTTAEQVTETHSPSEVFARIGRGLVSGLVQGLQSGSASGAVQSLMAPVIQSANALLPQWVAMLARFGNESWAWAQRAIPILKAQMLAWVAAVIAPLQAGLSTFTASLTLWSLEAWRWLQNALIPLSTQMLAFTTMIGMWANTAVLMLLKLSATSWATTLWLWIPNELIPGIQPQWALFLQNCLDNMKKIEGEMYKAGKRIGQMIIKGIVEAIKDGQSKIIQIFIEVVNNAIAAAKRELGIASPSKVFYTIGEQIMAGMANGIKDGARGVTRSLDNAVGGLSPNVAVEVPTVASNIANDINSQASLAISAATVPAMQQAAVAAPKITNDYSASQMVANSTGLPSAIAPVASPAQLTQQRIIENNTTNQSTYQLTVNSDQSSQGVVNDFYLMQVMAGA